MRFVLIGKAKDVFNTIRQLALLEVLLEILTWDTYEVDKDWWQLRLWTKRN